MLKAKANTLPLDRTEVNFLTAPHGSRGESLNNCRPMQGFVDFIEQTDWDRRFLRYAKKADFVCWVVITTSVLLFIHALLFQ